ncbi:hypothetical protein HN954_04270 [bacterium]|nr:hypothetical protein [bacterium]MBT6831919.1 hypothetical protein [bacterium]MBT6996615.1 hypothetical protein [bacterium]MBT7773035.1 hypothetical protein [bacterium]
MKKLFVLAAAFLLIGCGKTEPDSPLPTIETEVANTATIGETCGGAAEKLCESKLECVFDFDKADARGRCVDNVVDKEIKCPLAHSPVCGQKGLQKNGYLNECEATRHGAEILHAGFCTLDPAVENNCEAKAIGIGICFKVMRGFEFDAETNRCVQKNVGGCEAEIPFQSQEKCEEMCL